MRHRAQNKLRARKRYRRMKNNAVFKRRQRMYRMHPSRYRRIGGDGGFFPIPFWSDSMGSGFVVGADDQNVYYVTDRDPDTVRDILHQDFLDTAVFFEDGDINSFFSMLDTALDIPVVARVVSDAMVWSLDDGEDPA